jgi:hypothetical protein
MMLEKQPDPQQPKLSDPPRARFWLIFIAVSAALLYLLAPVLTPFLFAALLAYLGDPLIDRLEARKMSRSLAVTPGIRRARARPVATAAIGDPSAHSPVQGTDAAATGLY